MKMPRDISSKDLIKLLKYYGYIVTRQPGSHIRLTTIENGEHHITIPDHNPIKIETLSAILTDVAAHFNKSKDELAAQMFR